MLDRTLFAVLLYFGSSIAGLVTLTSKPTETARKQSSSAIVAVTTTTNKTENVLFRQVETQEVVEKAEVELATQMLNPKAPPIAYWERVAECETNLDWEDKGKYGGGLGIFTRGKFRDDDMGTWERYGGEEFARHPSGATKTEQIVVANRIAIFGYSTVVVRDPEKARIKGVPPTYVWDKKPVGFDGWGCIRNTVGSPVEWAKRQSR